jgi:hypothetical protein
VQLHIVKDVVKHHSIHLSRHPSVHLSGHPSILSWSIYSDGAEKEWNTNVAWRGIIYISVVNLFFFKFFICGFLDLGTLILSLFQQLKELGWVFFFFFFLNLFRILENFNVFYIAIIFYYSSMDARTSSH